MGRKRVSHTNSCTAGLGFSFFSLPSSPSLAACLLTSCFLLEVRSSSSSCVASPPSSAGAHKSQHTRAHDNKKETGCEQGSCVSFLSFPLSSRLSSLRGVVPAAVHSAARPDPSVPEDASSWLLEGEKGCVRVRCALLLSSLSLVCAAAAAGGGRGTVVEQQRAAERLRLS